jgi:hypothetical protein
MARQIVECVTKRKPFGALAERPSFVSGRGEWIRTTDLLHPMQTR